MDEEIGLTMVAVEARGGGRGAVRGGRTGGRK